MPSFDIVSEIDWQEVDNAINQAIKEIEGRYDFKGSQSEVKWDKKELSILGDDDYKMGAMKDILQSKLHRRGIDIKAFKFEKIETAGGKMLRQKVTIQQGIDKENAKDVLKFIKDSKAKVQAQIMDDKIRVTSKSIDELQSVIASVRAKTFEVPLQFNNMRS
ncbi:MAG: YajQ family cyclic di-GMP-binding protein [Bdellovibrionaceae bacterium]|nr:YajQ family cyclic di-GMP-binding protein [Pseudobdellovibrionaceae bacterium]